MRYTDLHTHTVFCDGKDTPKEMVISAVERGMECIGICTHGYTEFDQSYCIKKERIAEFQSEVRVIAEEYKGKIRILCGIEQDIFSDYPTDGFDYVIGSSHYVKNGDIYTPIDEDENTLKDAVSRFYGGDFYTLCEDYYKNVSLWAEKHCDIIGHLDLITKFNQGGRLFDEGDERYQKSAKACIDKLLSLNVPFEINTGAVSRGYRSEPYPSKELIKYIQSHGGKIILSSDAHSKESLCFGFDELKSGHSF